MSTVARLAATFYPHLTGRWDDSFLRESILRYIQPDMRVLDFGAGRGFVPQMNFSEVAYVCGCDVDSSVLSNPYLHEARIIQNGIPWPDESFDLVFANNVLEHLEKPAEVFREINRVLKPEGHLLFKTPNRFHYVALASRLTPHWFHEWFMRKHGTESHDVFPTYYRANSRSALRAIARGSGFRPVEFKAIEGRPEYLRSSAITYSLGIAYERLINASEVFADLRVIILGVLIKS